MSARALNWAWAQQPSTASQKLVLAALADRADDDGMCWPSIKWLAVKCAPMKDSTVRHAIQQLVDLGFLSKLRRMRRENGTLGSWLYQLRLSSEIPQMTSVSPQTLVTANPANDQCPPTDTQEPSKSIPGFVAKNAPNPGPPENGGLLTKEFIDDATESGAVVTRRVIGQIGRQIKKLLDEGVPPDRIRAGLARMLDRGVIQPANLAAFVTEASLPKRAPPMRYGRGMTTQQILDAAKGLDE